MIDIEKVNFIFIIIITMIIIICSIGIIMAMRFQSKQRKKYKDCIKIIKERENKNFELKNCFENNVVSLIDSSIDINLLNMELYNLYLLFENKIKNSDEDLTDVLTGNMKDFYVQKIQNYKKRDIVDIKENIELINYSIIEYDPMKIKFRITINCNDYKKIKGVIEGNNLEKKEEVVIITYENKLKKWKISNYEKVYEKKLS